MNILVLDDRKVFPFPDDWNVEYVRKLWIGLDTLRENPPNHQWDQIWVDWDLDGDNDASRFVYRLCTNAWMGIKATEKIVLCTHEDQKRDWMAGMFESAGFEVYVVQTDEQVEAMFGKGSKAVWH